jgi:DNA-binding NtrC family response regulator
VKEQPASAAQPASAGQVAAGATVLVVEDDVWLRFPFAEYLREVGLNAIEAGSAAEAIDVLMTTGIRVDLVFSDVAMPGAMDGFGLLQWAKANRPNLPVVITSGNDRRRRTAKDLYAHELFVDKPYDFDETIARIRGLIEEAEAQVKPDLATGTG